MKQSLARGRGSLSTMYTPDEFEVSDIMLHLPSLISKFNSSHRFSFTWGFKRKRSAIAPDPPLVLSSSPTPLSPLFPRTTNGEHEKAALSSETKDSSPNLKNQVSSPATPLFFSPSESDDKPHFRRKHSVKKKREDLSMKIEELTRNRDLLLGEVENVKRYYKELEAFNLRLRAKKQEVTVGVENSKCMGLDLRLYKSTVDHPFHRPQERALLEQITQINEGIKYPSLRTKSHSELTTSSLSPSIGLVVSNSNAGSHLPDLNICVDDNVVVNSSQPLDPKVTSMHLSRALAAQARQNRIRIYRVKNAIAANRIRYTYR